MKQKIFSLLLAVVLLASSFVLPADATASPTITVSNASASAGETVSVDISLANNPGIVSAQITIKYDSTALELLEVNDTGLLPGANHTPALVSPYTLTWQNGTATKDFTVNGKIASLKFKINEAAAIDSVYKIEASYDFDNYEIINYNMDPVKFQIQSGSVTVAGATSSIKEASFELSSCINANLYAELAASHTAAKMRFTMHGKQTVVEGEETDRDGIWKFQFQKIAPQCMGDTFKAELILGDVVLDVIEEYSVRSYCDMLFSSSASELNITQAKFNAAKTMMADLLEYGAMAQKFKNHKTDELVNEGITGQSTFKELEAALWDKELGATTTPGTQFTGANVWFDNENKLYFMFKAPGCTETNFSVKVTDSDTGVTNEYTLSDFEVISAEDNHYGLLSEPVPVAHFSHYFTITLNSVTVDRRGNRVLTTIQTLDYYGINAYIYAMQNKRDAGGELTPMAMLARAAYCYGDSAAAYDAI